MPHDTVLVEVPVADVVLLDGLRRPGESTTEVISRLARDATAAPTNAAPPGAAAAPTQAASLASALSTFLGGGAFRAERNPTGRFVSILAHAIAQQPNAVTALVGANHVFGGRCQFGSEADVAASGANTRPVPIAGTNICTLTNLSTGAKRRVVGQALEVLGYPPASIAEARAAIDPPAAGGGP